MRPTIYVMRSLIAIRNYFGLSYNPVQSIIEHNSTPSQQIVSSPDMSKFLTKAQPWTPVCFIHGFSNISTATHFHHLMMNYKSPRNRDILDRDIKMIDRIIHNHQWPSIHIDWFDHQYAIVHPQVVNSYHEFHTYPKQSA